MWVQKKKLYYFLWFREGFFVCLFFTVFVCLLACLFVCFYALLGKKYIQICRHDKTCGAIHTLLYRHG